MATKLLSPCLSLLICNIPSKMIYYQILPRLRMLEPPCCRPHFALCSTSLLRPAKGRSSGPCLGTCTKWRYFHMFVSHSVLKRKSALEELLLHMIPLICSDLICGSYNLRDDLRSSVSYSSQGHLLILHDSIYSSGLQSNIFIVDEAFWPASSAFFLISLECPYLTQQVFHKAKRSKYSDLYTNTVYEFKEMKMTDSIMI